MKILPPRGRQRPPTSYKQRGSMLLDPYRAAPAVFTYDGADFDGTNDLLYRNSAFTGMADSKTGSLSVWIMMDTVSGLGTFSDLVHVWASTFETVFLGPDPWTDGAGTYRTDSYMYDSGGANRMHSMQAGGGSAVTTGGWHHWLLSWDVAAGTVHHYIDNVNVASGPTTSNADIDWATGFSSIQLGGRSTDAAGATRTPTYDGGVAELWLAPGQFIDFSNSANRDKFRSGTGHPISLGATGSLPTGTAPMIYLHIDQGESAANFATNRSGNGNLSTDGALTTRGTRP